MRAIVAASLLFLAPVAAADLSVPNPDLTPGVALPLADAQNQIAADWRVVYRYYFNVKKGEQR